MLVSSKKNKARRLQNYIVKKILIAFPQLTNNDVWGALMGQSGEDVKMSELARSLIPFSFEAKNTERLDLWGSISQAEKNAKDKIPVLVFKRNHSKVYAVIEFDAFMEVWLGNNNN